MSVDKMSVDGTSVDGKSVDEMSVGEKSVAEMSVGKMSVDVMSVDKMRCCPSLRFASFSQKIQNFAFRLIHINAGATTIKLFTAVKSDKQR